MPNSQNEAENSDVNELSLETQIQLPEIKPVSMVGRIFRISLLIVLPIGLLVGSIAYKAILDASKPKVEAEKTVEKSATVEILHARFVDIRPIISIYGQTVAGKQLNLRTNVGGEVVQISDNFKSGALVDKDELLFTIDPFTYEGALLSAENNYADTLSNIEELKLRSKSEQISLITAKEQLVAAQKDYERSVTLRKGGTITSKALDDKLLVVTQRKQTVELSENSLQAQLSQMKRFETGLKNIQWSIDKAQRDLDHTKVYASFDAYVQDASLQIGQLAGTNDQIATLIDRDKMDIVFTLSDSLYGRILAQDGTLIGRKVDLLWQAGNTTQKFTATIDRVAAQITASSGGIELFAQIDNLKDIATLRVGSFMTVQIPDRLFENVIRLPEHLIYDGDKVYILNEQVVKTEAIDGEPENKQTDETDIAKTETRLKPILIKTVGYDGKFTLVTGANEENQIVDGDVILASKLSTAGTDVLVITREKAEQEFKARQKKSAEEKRLKDEAASDASALENNKKAGE